MAESNHRAEVVPVVLEKHPNADRLSIVRVKAYTCVVATADWQGVDKAVYIQPDTVVPDTPEFAFLKRMNTARAELDKEFAAGTLTQDELQQKLTYIEEQEKAHNSALRITAKKFRGIQSFGMLWPAPVGLNVGDDAWDALGLTRYEPPLPANAGGEAERPPDLVYIPDYDVENYYNFPSILVPGEEVVATEKLHGGSARFVYAKSRETGEYRMFCGSRTEWKKPDPTNMFWLILKLNPWIEAYCTAHPDHIVYGEVFGNVQSLKYGCKPNDPNKFRAFDVLAIDHYIDYADFEAAFKADQRVPVIYRGPWDAEKLITLSKGKSTLADHYREGIVVHPVKERIDMTLGRVILKLVSPEYLEKGK